MNENATCPICNTKLIDFLREAIKSRDYITCSICAKYYLKIWLLQILLNWKVKVK